MEIPTRCTLCPRRCGANRAAGETGLCGGADVLRAARAALHFWEEPCISGTRGSGTVFFSGCPLHCCYCQNYTISAENYGRPLTTRQLADAFLRLQEAGAHNINLVTAGHWLPWVLEALALARPALTVPIVYNTGGYETPASLAALDGVVDVYLTDLKYVSAELSALYSDAPDYFAVAGEAACLMCAQTGAPRFDENGLLQRGVIVRHLALPGAVEDSFAALDWLASALPRGGFLMSLMSQYTPFYRAKTDPRFHALARRISTWEYRRVVNRAVELGLTQGFMQEKSSAKEEYTPVFDGTGL